MLCGFDGPSSRPPQAWCRLPSTSRTTFLLALLCFSTSVLVAAQTPSSSISSDLSTQSGALNDPEASSAGTGASPTAAASSPSSAAAGPVATSIPPLDFGGAPVPFLMQRPIDSAYLQSSSGSHWRKTPYMPDVYFSGCSGSAETAYVDSDHRLNVSAVYVQWDPNLDDLTLGNKSSDTQGSLRISGVGATGQTSYATSNTSASTTKLLSAINIESKVLSFDVFFNRTYLCSQLIPTTADPYNPLVRPVASCAYGPGDVAFGAAIPLSSSFSASTVWTTIRLIDSSRPPLNIACIQVAATHYNPGSWWWKLIHILPIILAAVFLVLASVSRVLTAITMRRRAFRARSNEKGTTTYMQERVGPALIGALSGQGLIFSPALLRYATPSCWDIILHAQWVALLAGFAVRWPEFVYPFLRQVAWASLLGNVTLIQADGHAGRFNVHGTNATLPMDPTLAAQLTTNATSPVWLNTGVPNTLLNLNGARSGLEAYAHMIGLSPKDLFGTCLAVWLIIVAIVVAISAVVWILSCLMDRDSSAKNRHTVGMTSLQTSQDSVVEPKRAHGTDGRRICSRFGLMRLHRYIGVHGALLHGNLVRALYLFHLPIVALSTYHISTHAEHSTRSVALAGLSLALLGILAPLYLIWCLSRISTNKLYEDVGLLLALGPLYNTYSPGSQLYACLPFGHGLVVGLVIGAAQSAGAIQAIFLVIAELTMALVGSLWLPWGEGAMMGPLSFLASVCRLLTAILVLLLTPLVGFGSDVTGWLAYGVLLLQAIFFAAAILVLFTKLAEGSVRLFANVGFDERHTARNAGLFGVLRRVRRRRYKGSRKGEKRVSRGSVDSDQDLGGHAGQQGSGAGSTLVGTGSSIPMKMARGSSYGGTYHDSYNSNNTGAPNDFLSAGGPYQSYLRGDPHDDGNIMEALPADSHSPYGAGTSAESTPGGGVAGASSSFVRVGGGRATDAAPYQTLPRNNGSKNDRAEWVDPRSSFHALQNLRSPDRTAPAGAQKEKRRRRLFGVGRRKGAEEDEWSEDDEDDEDDDGAWNASARKRPQQWAGVAKLGAAFAALRGGGNKSAREGAIREDGESDDDAPSAPSKGFEVMRPPRPQRASARLAAAAPVQTQTSGLLAPGASTTLAGSSSEEPPSPIADDTQPFLHHGRGGSGAAAVNKRLSGLEAPSSITHESDGRDSEDRFWLQPGTSQGGSAQPQHRPPSALGAVAGSGLAGPGTAPTTRTKSHPEARWEEAPRDPSLSPEIARQRERERVRKISEAGGGAGEGERAAGDMYYDAADP